MTRQGAGVLAATEEARECSLVHCVDFEVSKGIVSMRVKLRLLRTVNRQGSGFRSQERSPREMVGAP